jgi:hypothetical protein
MSNRGKKLKIFTFLALTLVLGFSCTPVSGLYVWDVNDPNSCPLEAEIGESIIIRGNPPPQYNVVRDPYNATDEQKQLCSELRGSDITMGEFLRIVYPHIWNGLSPEDQKMYDSYKKAWGAVDHTCDPIPLPPWHEPGEAAPSKTDSSPSPGTLANTLLSRVAISKFSMATTATTGGNFDMASFAASYRSGGTAIASKGFGSDVLAARGIGG